LRLAAGPQARATKARQEAVEEMKHCRDYT
jgi:hypothetical protein